MGNSLGGAPVADEATSSLRGVLADHSGVVVFVESWCPYCARAASALTAAGIPFHSHELSRVERDALPAISSGSTTIPQAFIFGVHIGGCLDGPASWMGILKHVERQNSESAARRQVGSVSVCNCFFTSIAKIFGRRSYYLYIIYLFIRLRGTTFSRFGRAHPFAPLPLAPSSILSTARASALPFSLLSC